MAGKIKTRDEFKAYVLRKLGFPVIYLNIDEDQINDRVDEALNMFKTYHYDGRQPIFYVHQITSEDFANKFITLPPDIVGITRILPLSSMFNVGSVFSLQYQMVLQDMWQWSSIQMTHYYQIYQYQQLMEQVLVGTQPIRFTETDNRLYIDMNWNRIENNFYIVAEGYRALNPDNISVMIDTPGDWVEGETILAGNGAAGTVFSVHRQSRQELFVSDYNDTPFAVGTVVTGQTSGATATIKLTADAKDVWNNRWLQNYAAALLTQQFGVNLSKTMNTRLPSGEILNGEKIEARGNNMVAAAEQELFNSFTLPPMMLIG